MNKFSLELLFHIIGISSASGLIYKDNTLHIVGDNSGFLYEYNIGSTTLKSIPLVENPSANMAKNVKPDFEAITEDDNHMFVFGSGSTENRNKMVMVDKQSKSISATVDLTNLYLSMQSFGAIKPTDFNIEGVIYNSGTWYFLQRGNGKKGKNGIFTVESQNLAYDFTMLYNEFKLPKINGIRSSFTDAVLVGETIYFLATAEDTKSTYTDGEIVGSLVGSINTKDMKIGSSQIITQNKKFEGITLYKQTDNEIEFLLCEDNDTNLQESDVYKLVLKK